MEYRKITSAGEWRDLWLSKFGAELQKRNLPAPDVSSYRSVLSDYLTRHKGNPREIGMGKLRTFLAKRKSADIAPLVVFYESVARSETHLEQLSRISATRVKASRKKAS
jgi:hypothetical protein